MRLFVAADLDHAARAAVGNAVARLRDRAEQDRRGSTRGVSWADPRNLHLTLHFLGDIDEARLPPLTKALAPPLALEPPGIGLAGWGVFPPRGPARVIWIGVSAGAAALASAHGVLGERLRSAGITPEARPFSPHLTVGRVKIPSGPLWGRLTASMPAEPLCGWPLEACTLFQSLLSPAGPTYRALLTIPFTADLRREPPDIREVRHAE
jgi:RNA 2',3'-cyclic 3'-phosphodiesterase